MNSALKPVLTSPSGPQNSALSKPVHPQPSATYGPPSSAHMVDVTTTLAPSNHPSPAFQQNHFPPLSVYNTAQYNNSSVIAGNNHSIANISQSSGQFPAASKTPYSDGYQANAAHAPVNPIPPVSQTLPATHNTPLSPVPQTEDKHQTNGTSPVKSAENAHNSPQVKERKSPEKLEEKIKKPEQSSEQVNEDSALPSHTETTNNVAPSTINALNSNETTNVTSKSTNDSIPLNQIENKSDNSPSKNVAVEVEEKSVGPTQKPKHSPKHQKLQRNSARSKTAKVEEESPTSAKTETKTTPKPSGYTVKSKRMRVKTQPYQSPLPEIEIITKISSSTPKSKTTDDKLIVFYKNEFLAVRNSEGSFFICRAVQNIYRSSPKIKIRWLSQDKNEKSGEIYIPDFYDTIDFDCILTNLNMDRIDKGRHRLPPKEKERTDSILKRSLAVEKGEVTSPSLTEEHPDGIDVSLYKEEGQLKKKKRKGVKRKGSPMKAAAHTSNSVKSPEQSKVRKVTRQAVRRTMTPKNSQVSKTVTRTSLKNDPLKRTTSKVSAVDEKKAKILAKVAKKVIPTKNVTKTVGKNAKTNKVAPSSSKIQQRKVATRKTRRSAKK